MSYLTQILDQLREETFYIRDVPEAYSIANDGGIVANVPAQMWHTIAKARTVGLDNNRSTSTIEPP